MRGKAANRFVLFLVVLSSLGCSVGAFVQPAPQPTAEVTPPPDATMIIEGWTATALANPSVTPSITPTFTPSPTVTSTPIPSPTPAPEGSVYDQRWRPLLEYNYESLAAAEEAFREALEREPDNAAIYVSQAIMYLHVYRMDEAEESLDRAQELDPQNPQLYVALGRLHFLRLEETEALQSFEMALEIDPDNIDAYFGIADYYHRQDAYYSEFDVHDHIIDIAPEEELPEAYFWRGTLYDTLGYYNEALADYERVLDFDPNYAPAIHGIGVVYSKQGDDERAWQEYERALAADPTYAIIYRSRANMLRRQCRVEEGIENMDKALELAPFDTDTYNSRAWFFAREGDYARAVEEINHAIELSPYLYLALYNRGLFYGYADQYQEAIDSYTQAIELKPDYHEAYINRATVYMSLEDWETAIEDLDRALALGEIPHAYWNKGRSLYGLGRVEEALWNFDRAISLYTGFSDYFLDRAVAHFDLGHLEEAVADIQTATDMDTTLRQIRGNDWFEPRHNYFIQGVGLDYAGYPDEAIEAYQQFLQVYNVEDEFRVYVQGRLTELGG